VDRAFLLQLAQHQHIEFVEACLAFFLVMPTVLTKCSITCDCVILNLPAHQPDGAARP
jgi:hypothetical protein